MGKGLIIEENFLGDMSPTPEDKAREVIDGMLEKAGWHVCDFKDANIHAALGVVIRNYPLNKGHGFADYPRVVCIAEAYSKFDIDTVEVVPLRIELLLYRHYENAIFSLEPMTVSETIASAPTAPEQAEHLGQAESSQENLLAKASSATAALFQELRQKILALDESIKEKATSIYMGYRVTKNFAEIYIQKNQLRMFLRPVDYDDPRCLVQPVPEGYDWTLNRSVCLKAPEDLDYVMGLIEQSYKDVL